MTEYNKRFLKNALEDIREEKDSLLLKEIEAANNNPLFANTNETDAKILNALEQSLKHSKKKKKKKALLRAASILVALLVGFSVISLSVEGVRERIYNLISNDSNSSYSIITSSDNRNGRLLADYEGTYVPTYIPQGYTIEKVENEAGNHTIIIKNDDGKIISFAEHLKSGLSLYYDTENLDSYEEKTIGDFDAIVTVKGDATTVILLAEESVICIVSNDPNIDLVGFANHIEKR